jgi:serine/threonine-protein kinase HipA
MTSKPREIFVYIQLPGSLESVTCGRLTWQRLRTGEPVGDFVYGQSYRRLRGAVPIDPINLPIDSGQRRSVLHGGLFGVLRDASPDAWGRRVIERSLSRTDLDEPDYLLNSPEDRAGALSFGLGAVPPPPLRDFNRTLELGALLDAARRIEDDLPASMGGARPKAVVRDDERLWLAKFPSRGDRWNNARVEHAMLTLARECGVRSPAHRLERIGEDDVLLVERFDRTHARAETEDRVPRFPRHRMVSALTVLGCEENERDRWSYPQLATELRRWVTDPRRDAEELFRRMVFNALISNTDDHPRNHALIAPGSDWHLSPVYDLTPTPSHSQERDLAMRVGNWHRRASRANVMSQCNYFQLSDADAGRIVDELHGIVSSRWRDHLLAAGVTENDCDRVASAFVPPGFEFAPPAM